MIAAAIHQIVHELNQTMRISFGATDDLVIVSNLLEPDGGLAPQSADRVAAFLVSVERDPAPPRGPGRIDGLQRSAVVQPPMHLSLLVMFVANFSGSKYPEALKAISRTAAFFQGRPLFDRHNTPGLDPRLDRLSVELENLSLAELSHVWGVLGGRYMPSLLYRVRTVVVDSGRIEAQTPTIVDARVGATPETV